MAISYKKNEVKVDLANYRHLIRGQKKIGKTTFFRDFIQELYGDLDKGLLIECGTEDGAKALDGVVYINAPDWSTFMEIVDDLCENKEDNDFKFIGIDTIDEIIEIGKTECMRLHRKEKGEPASSFNACFGGYGAPRERLASLVDKAIARLYASGYGIIEIAHTKYKTVKPKDGDEYEQLTGSLANDYDGIFANKADVIAMIVQEREVEDKRVVGNQRYIYFRGDGFIDAGGRFPDIADKVEFSARNYIDAVSEAIKKSITTKPVDDKYLADKAKKEQEEREAYYQEHKDELATAEAFEEANSVDKKEAAKEELVNEINSIMKALTQKDRDVAKSKLASAGCPATPSALKNASPDVLAKALGILKS